MAECDARQAELKKKCKDLRKRVQTEEQHVQETRSKIDRATKKQQEEKGFQEQKASLIIMFFRWVVSGLAVVQCPLVKYMSANHTCL